MIVIPPFGMFKQGGAGGPTATVPTTAAGWFAGRTADDFWLLDEASGNIVSEVNIVTLTQTGAAPTYQQSAAEFPVPPNTNYGITFADNANTRFAAASTALYDIDATTSIAFAMVVNPGTTAPATRRFFAKFSGNGYLADIEGDDDLRFRILGTSGTVVGRILGSYEDGNPYLVVWSVDRNTQLLEGFTDRGDTASISIAGTGSPSNAGQFGFGGVGNTPNFTCLGLAVFTGADAEGWTVGEVTGAWATWGPVP